MSPGVYATGLRVIHAYWGGVLGEQDNCIFLPVRLAKKLSLVPGSTVLYKMGSLIRQVSIGNIHCSGTSDEPVFFVSPNLACTSQIPDGARITLTYRPDTGIVTAGPLVGLFTVRNILPDSEYGTQEPTLRALAKSMNDLGGIVFVFCPEDLDWDSLTVKGRIPVPGHDPALPGWTELILPLPDVVYDRVPSRSVELRPEVQEAKARLFNLPGLHYFNPKFLDKWETHLALKEMEEVNEYLPPTRLVESPDDILDFLNMYSSVFLKPCSGSLGRRIIKIGMNPEGHYSFKYRSRERQTVEGVTPDFNKLMRTVRWVMGKKNYVVQKDLELAVHEGSPFDVRVLAQKDMWGRWRRTKMYVRKAAPDSFLSNLSDGGKPMSIATVIGDVFGEDVSASGGLGDRIRRAVSSIPPALEKSTKLIWGELGIDLGIDRRGRVWLIEINSKPFRALVTETGSYKIIERSLKRPLEYAKYLAGFYRHSTPPDSGLSGSEKEEKTWM